MKSRAVRRGGFTLIELLLVIAIVAVIAVVLIVTLSPSELLKQARDSKRVSDLTTLNKALALYQSTFSSGSLGSSSVLYVSLPDSSATCANLGLPAAPGGYTYSCKPTSTYRNVDGTGWIPLNFAGLDAGNPFSSLPTDPTNTTTTLNYYIYSTSGGQFALSAAVESTKYASVASNDGGPSSTRFEKGTNLGLASGHGGSDSDAAAFFTAAGITDGTQQSAVNQLVLDLKAANIWTKMSALYPFVGGDATKHSYNLRNPAQYQITWSGTVTHDANGITGNGSSGYGNTNLTATALTNNNTHLSVYVRTSTAETASKVEIGAAIGPSADFELGTRRDGYFLGIMDENVGTPEKRILVNTGNAQGFGLLSRRSSTDLEGYRNGVSIATNTNAHTGNLPGYTIYIGASNWAGSANVFSNRNIAFASIGSGLTDTEAADLYAAVQAFETTLGRNI